MLYMCLECEHMVQMNIFNIESIVILKSDPHFNGGIVICLAQVAAREECT